MNFRFYQSIFPLLITAFFVSTFFIAHSSNAQFLYSHQFQEGVVYMPGTPQYDDWISFRGSLPPADIVQITLFGSNNQVGRSCTDPGAAQIIANGLRNFDPAVNPIDTIVAEAECGGFLWRVVNCSDLPNGVMIKVLQDGDNLGACSCSASYALGPAIFDGDWGGIDGPICSAPTQTISLSVLIGSRAVPTLSEWGFIVTAGVLGIVGLLVIRKKQIIVKS